ncbi:MAG: hypothetical protein RL077_3109 [Verrucomicrobiota bacterium]|jgi:hypothetical protein
MGGLACARPPPACWANRPTARIGAAPSAIVVASCRDVRQMVEVCAPGIAFGLGSERRQPFGGLEPIAWGRLRALPEAAAPRFAHPVGGDNSGANGMERDVITDLGEMGGVLDQRGLGPTLKPRAMLTVESSQPRRERRLQPGHPLHEVRFRCCEGEGRRGGRGCA